MGAEKTPTFSILIPTRNGVRYLPYAIESVLCQDSQDFELIVSDNMSEDGTAEYLATLDDPRLKKIKPDSVLSMTSHFEFLLAAARGTWITIVGDDDGLMPFFFERLAQIDLDEIKTEAVVFRRAYYFWSGCEELYKDFVVFFKPSPLKSYVDNRWATFLCLMSIIDYAHLPTLYTTGLVKRSLVERVKQASQGIFFHATSPDISSAAMLALHAKRHYRVEDPIFWTGTSPKSVGFSGRTSNKDRVTEFHKHNDQDSAVPKTILPLSFYEAIGVPALFYDALVTAPGKKTFWSSRIFQNFHVAGLLIRFPEEYKRISEAYPRRYFSFEINIFVLIVKRIKKSYEDNQSSISAEESGGAVLSSHDRQAFPTLREASAAAAAIHASSMNA